MDGSFYEALVEEAKKAGINRYVVGAVIQKGSSVLLLKRPEDEFMGGIYELPSGKVEEGETLDGALRREVEEETGLRVKEIKRYLGHFDYVSGSGKPTRQFNFAVAVEEPIEVRLQEHDDYAWVSREDLDRYPVTDSVKEVLRRFWGG